MDTRTWDTSAVIGLKKKEKNTQIKNKFLCIYKPIGQLTPPLPLKNETKALR